MAPTGEGLTLPGGGEWLLIGLAAVVLFGAKRIPELGRSLAEAIREFRGGLRDDPEGGPAKARRGRASGGKTG